ncbi:hypothetical protein CKAH01_00083 [Colletotrichum kahawae]|uniref:Uncharacterized protein n=1 Tax=Colletotrichum kahawae TaxID=34407 RepID=A0AAD9YWX1_COLKA|nr:hypothetical protein CKAH01_00083 [Colletotrichum kahawae]
MGQSTAYTDLPESPRRESEAQSGGFLTVRELPAYQWREVGKSGEEEQQPAHDTNLL